MEAYRGQLPSFDARLGVRAPAQVEDPCPGSTSILQWPERQTSLILPQGASKHHAGLYGRPHRDQRRSPGCEPDSRCHPPGDHLYRISVVAPIRAGARTSPSWRVPSPWQRRFAVKASPCARLIASGFSWLSLPLSSPNAAARATMATAKVAAPAHSLGVTLLPPVRLATASKASRCLPSATAGSLKRPSAPRRPSTAAVRPTAGSHARHTLPHRTPIQPQPVSTTESAGVTLRLDTEPPSHAGSTNMVAALRRGIVVTASLRWHRAVAASRN